MTLPSPSVAAANFDAALRSAAADGTLIRATFGKPASDLFPGKLLVTPETSKEGPVLRFVERFATRDVTKNWPVDEGLAKLSAWLGKRYQSATAFTREADFSLDHNRRGEARLTRGKATEIERGASTKRARPLKSDEAHAKTEQRSEAYLGDTTSEPRRDERAHRAFQGPFVDPSWPWLRDLGLVNGEGKVAKGMERKWRQVEKFLETFDALVREAGLADLPEIRVTDMGSGMGYLTFALYAHLERVAPGKARVTGVEARPDLVTSCKDAARKNGLDRLWFQEGRIGDKDFGAMDVLVALHACDTATDDALAAATRGGAKVILSVPCCHKQVRAQVAHAGAWGRALGWGILAERQAEMVTDAVRAKLLEAEGYRVNVAEFVSAEHTAKNVLIAAVRKGPNPRRTQVLSDVADMMAQFGVKEQKLAAELAKK